MLGFPGKRFDQMQRTIHFAISSLLHTALFFRVIALPGTEIWNHLRGDRVVRLEDLEEDYFLNPVNLSDVSDWMMKNIYKLAWVRFHGNPRRLANLARAHPDPLRLLKRAMNLLVILIGWRLERPSE